MVDIRVGSGSGSGSGLAVAWACRSASEGRRISAASSAGPLPLPPGEGAAPRDGETGTLPDGDRAEVASARTPIRGRHAREVVCHAQPCRHSADRTPRGGLASGRAGGRAGGRASERASGGWRGRSAMPNRGTGGGGGGTCSHCTDWTARCGSGGRDASAVSCPVAAPVAARPGSSSEAQRSKRSGSGLPLTTFGVHDLWPRLLAEPELPPLAQPLLQKPPRAEVRAYRARHRRQGCRAVALPRGRFQRAVRARARASSSTAERRRRGRA